MRITQTGEFSASGLTKATLDNGRVGTMAPDEAGATVAGLGVRLPHGHPKRGYGATRNRRFNAIEHGDLLGNCLSWAYTFRNWRSGLPSSLVQIGTLSRKSSRSRDLSVVVMSFTLVRRSDRTSRDLLEASDGSGNHQQGHYECRTGLYSHH